MERLGGYSTTGDEPIRLPPGFRFHPTDEELITHYLSPKVLDENFTTAVVGQVDLNKVEPWDLPWKAKMGEKEWYFFCVKDRKYPTGLRTNRATEVGYWKATGKDKEVYRAKVLVGMKKTLVFYGGRAPRGEKTNWVMHEYRLQGKNNSLHNYNFKVAKKEWVICRIFNKDSGGKEAHIYGSNMPPLMVMSSEQNHTRIAQGSHVTCFSNPTESLRDISVEEFSSSSRNSDFPVAPYTFSQDSIPEIGVNAYAWPNQEVGFKTYVDDQDFPISSTGLVDFGCLWDY